MAGNAGLSTKGAEIHREPSKIQKQQGRIGFPQETPTGLGTVNFGTAIR